MSKYFLYIFTSLLLFSACFKKQDNDFYKAIKNGDTLKIISILKENKQNSISKNFPDALFIAQEFNQTTIFCFLIKNGADIYLQNKNKKTVFEVILKTSNQYNYLNKEKSIMLAEIIDKGFIPDSTQDIEGRYLLHFLAQNCYSPELPEKLLEKKLININCTDNFGLTPLHIACHEYNYSMCEFLLRNNANVNAQTSKIYGKKTGRENKPSWFYKYDLGSTPLDIRKINYNHQSRIDIQQNRDIDKLLISKGAKTKAELNQLK